MMQQEELAVAKQHTHITAEISITASGTPAGELNVIDVQNVTVSIVIPTYREAPNVRALVNRICAAMSGVTCPYEILIVDDDSRDGTDRVVHELSGPDCPLRMIARVGERDLSSAVLRGFSEATGDILICMDADLSHPPEAIPTLLDCLCQPGVELVLGSRYFPGGSADEKWGVIRAINSTVATALARPFTSVKDPMSGFFAVHRAVYRRSAFLRPIGYKIALELIVKCGCSIIREVPIHFAARQAGQSKLTLIEQIKFLRHLGRLLCFKLSNSCSHILARERTYGKSKRPEQAHDE